MTESLSTTVESVQREDPFEERHKPVSQTKLIWRRFLRHKLGVIGGVIVVLLLFAFLFADFFSPYGYLSQHHDVPYAPPMINRIHFDGVKVFVFGLVQNQIFIKLGSQLIRAPGAYDYTEDVSHKYYLKLFAPGDEYKFLGLFSTNIHILGTGEPPDSMGQFFVLGSDELGQDILSRMLFGGRITLAIAPMVILISFLFGSLLGGLSGYLGGATDTLIQRIVEIFMSLPRLALLLAMSGILTYAGYIPPMTRFWSIVGLLSLISWAPLARVIRGQFLSLREHEFTQAAKALGATNTRIIFRHILPNIMSYLVVAATLAVPDLIILESVLSFLGFGIQHPLVSWGMMLFSLQGTGFDLHATYHAWLFLPAIFIVLSVLSFNFLGDALRDALDPFAVHGVKEDMKK
ncbi:ABC transporter permease [Candidatus Acetothermia bacterium]|nr:ABC transporter permease [Candidatus Acetothermia bacterium]MBI3643130.1 ABC transporter permease [Candidatus Acetothermia bacterium]